MNAISRRAWPSAIALGVLTLVLVSYYASTAVLANPEPYLIGASASLTVTAFVVNVLSAIYGAWRGGVYARTKLHIRRSRRVPLRVIAATLWPQWLVVVVALLLIYSFRLWQWGLRPPLPDPRIMVPTLLSAIAVSMLGWAIGAAIGNALALAVAGIAAYVLSVGPLFAQNLGMMPIAGDFSSCCSIFQEPDPRMYAMPLLMSTGLMLAAFGLFRLGVSRIIALSLAAVTALGAVGVGASMPRTGGWQLWQTPLTCQTAPGSGITICVWPEHEALLGTEIQAVDAAVAAWQQELAFTPAVTTITERVYEGAPPAGTLTLNLRQTDGAPQMISRLAERIVPNADICRGPTVSGRLTMQSWLPYLLSRSAGLSPSAAAAHLPFSDPDVAEAAWQTFLAQPIPDRAQALRDGLAAMEACPAPVMAEPGS